MEYAIEILKEKEVVFNKIVRMARKDGHPTMISANEKRLLSIRKAIKTLELI